MSIHFLELGLLTGVSDIFALNHLSLSGTIPVRRSAVGSGSGSGLGSVDRGEGEDDSEGEGEGVG